MLTRQQRFRRLRQGRARSEPRVPLSLFAPGGDLAATPSPTLLKSFSDSGARRASVALDGGHEEADQGHRMRRNISDNFISESRSLFRNREPSDSAVVVGRGKGVAFRPQVQVYLIPTARELSREAKSSIWWSKTDLQSFQRALVTALPPNTDLKQSVLALGSFVADNEHGAAGEGGQQLQQPVAAAVERSQGRVCGGREDVVLAVCEAVPVSRTYSVVPATPPQQSSAAQAAAPAAPASPCMAYAHRSGTIAVPARPMGAYV